jgi:hypothetical protein
MQDISVGIVVICITLVFIKVYSPLWKKDHVTLLISDDELLLLFPDEVPLRLSALITKVFNTHGVLPGSSELSFRLRTMVKSGQLKMSTVSEKRENIFGDQEEVIVSKITLYSRVV